VVIIFIDDFPTYFSLIVSQRDGLGPRLGHSTFHIPHRIDWGWWFSALLTGRARQGPENGFVKPDRTSVFLLIEHFHIEI